MKKNILALTNYVVVTKNNSTIYTPDEIVNICKRRNNPKRDFLFVNSLQGKHIPVEPSKTFTLFDELVSGIITSISSNEKIVVIGFAETATAIGHYIASSLSNCIYYMQTTREPIELAKSILEFKEEHSHATEQFLYGTVDALKCCDRIIFVDDEITTGNTILNFIRELEAIGINTKFSVATLLNWQNDEWTQKFMSLNIDTYFVLRGKIKDIKATVPVDVSVQEFHYETLNGYPTVISLKCSVSDFYKERIGCKPYDFKEFSNELYLQTINALGNALPQKDDDVLVLGTEEFMFTPMVFGKMLSEKLNVHVKFHATTRSPIETSKKSSYAIHHRYPISSCYDKNRNTFIYNLKRYDKVYIITDVIPNDEFIKDISHALASVGCSPNDITIITLKG